MKLSSVFYGDYHQIRENIYTILQKKKKKRWGQKLRKGIFMVILSLCSCNRLCYKSKAQRREREQASHSISLFLFSIFLSLSTSFFFFFLNHKHHVWWCNHIGLRGGAARPEADGGEHLVGAWHHLRPPWHWRPHGLHQQPSDL